MTRAVRHTFPVRVLDPRSQCQMLQQCSSLLSNLLSNSVFMFNCRCGWVALEIRSLPATTSHPVQRIQNNRVDNPKGAAHARQAAAAGAVAGHSYIARPPLRPDQPTRNKTANASIQHQRTLLHALNHTSGHHCRCVAVRQNFTQCMVDKIAVGRLHIGEN